MRDTSPYQVDGVRVPSVTEVLRLTGLDDWSGIDPDVLAAAAERGTIVHQACELVDAGDLDLESLDDAVRGYVDAYRLWKRESGWQVDQVELALVSRRGRYAGRLDRICRIPGRQWPALVDLKTGVETAATPLQTAGYADLYTEHHGGTVSRHALYLRADGSYRLVDHQDPHDRHDFGAAVRVAHRILRAHPERIVP